VQIIHQLKFAKIVNSSMERCYNSRRTAFWWAKSFSCQPCFVSLTSRWFEMSTCASPNHPNL